MWVGQSCGLSHTEGGNGREQGQPATTKTWETREKQQKQTTGRGSTQQAGRTNEEKGEGGEGSTQKPIPGTQKTEQATKQKKKNTAARGLKQDSTGKGQTHTWGCGKGRERVWGREEGEEKERGGRKRMGKEKGRGCPKLCVLHPWAYKLSASVLWRLAVLWLFQIVWIIHYSCKPTPTGTKSPQNSEVCRTHAALEGRLQFNARHKL